MKHSSSILLVLYTLTQIACAQSNPGTPLGNPELVIFPLIEGQCGTASNQALLLTRRQAVEMVIRNLIPECNDAARQMFRAGFHDVGTYDRATQTGGADGSLQFEMLRIENISLRMVTKFAMELSKQFRISVADALQIGAKLAVQVCGGPTLKTFVYGRRDATVENAKDRLLMNDASTDLIIKTFTQSLGFTLEETVAIIGAGHSVAHSRRPGSVLMDKPLDSTPSKMDITYFQELANSPTKAISASVGRLVSDNNMMLNAEMKGYVETFAKDEAHFRQLFQAAMEKSMDLGATFDLTKDSTMDTETVMVTFPMLSTCVMSSPNPGLNVRPVGSSPSLASHSRGGALSSWLWLVGLIDGLLFI